MSRSNKPSRTCPCYRTHFGLYHKDQEKKAIPLPLKTMDVDVKILESIARVEYTQVYQNNTQNTLHVYFVFPVSTDSCFETLTVKYKSFTLEGEIKKKEHARDDYQKAMREDKTAVYAEIKEESKDLMLIKIGNMEPLTTITIKLSYIEQLDISANKLWKYTVLGTLKPRYASHSDIVSRQNRPKDDDGEELSIPNPKNEDLSIINYPMISPDDPQAYKWKIKVEIESQANITFVECPTYKIKTEYEDMVKAIVQLDPTEDFTPTKDFTIYFSIEQLNKPHAFLTQYEDGYCAMLNFVPQTNHKSLTDAYKAELENDGIQIPDIEFEKVKGEFIFLLDRSGSMSGHPIKMAREALVIFLKSLPKDAYFNIISFGSTYEFYSETGSKEATQENIAQATQEVLDYDGDMGGTEILSALEAGYRLTPKKDFKKKIFLLTDGEVYNMKAIFKSIEEHADIARVFSIGIGKSASRELIIQSARYGKGCYEFVDDVSRIGEKVVSLLTLSMQICAHSFQVNFPMGLDPKMVIPHPETVLPIYEGKYLTFFVFFGKEISKRESIKLNLHYKQDEKLQGHQQTVDILIKDCMTDGHPLSQAIWKLGFHKLFSVFDTDKSKSTDSLVYFGKDVITRHEIEPLSIRYGVLSSKTAFICVMKDENNMIKSTKKSEVIVPSLLQERSPKLATNSESRSRSRSKSNSPKLLRLKKSKMKSSAQPTKERIKMKRKASRSRSRSKSSDFDDFSCLEEFSLSSNTGRGGRGGSRGGGRGGSRGGRSGLSDRSVNFQAQAENYSDDDSELLVFKKKNDRRNLESIKTELKVSKNQLKKIKFEGQFGGRNKEYIDLEKHKLITKVVEMETEMEEEEKYTSMPQSQQVNKKSTYDQVFSIISQQDSSGRWEYSEVLLNQLSVNSEKFKENLPESVRQMTNTLAIAMTALVMMYLQQKCSEHRKVWMLVFKKGENFLKSQNMGLQDFQKLRSIC